MRVNKEGVGFEWDQGNSDKPKKHGLTLEETEEAFLDEKKVIFSDWQHSLTEKSVTLLGKTKRGKLLNITYTTRGNKVRVITARTINRKEVQLYEKAT